MINNPFLPTPKKSFGQIAIELQELDAARRAATHPKTPSMADLIRVRSASAPTKPPRQKTLTIINPAHAAVNPLSQLIGSQTPRPTRLRMPLHLIDRLQADAFACFPGVPPAKTEVPKTFMGLPIIAMTAAEVAALAAPRRTRGPGKKKHLLHVPNKGRTVEKASQYAARTRDTLYVRLWSSGTMTIANVQEYMRVPMLRRRKPFDEVGMSAACRDKLWAEAVAYTTECGLPHPHMPDQNTFFGLPVRVIAPQQGWGGE